MASGAARPMSIPVRRAVLVNASLIVLLGVVAWRVLGLGVADHFARNEPGRALGWRADHPEALVRAAALDVEGRPDKAAGYAQAALRANPLDGRAYRIQGELAARRGDSGQALRFHEMASKLSPRDLRTHVWLEREYLRRGQLLPALGQIDLLLRLQPQLRERQFPVLQAIAQLPPAQATLVSLLSRRPPWREAFIAQLCRLSERSDSLDPFMLGLRRAPGGLSEAELSSWIERLTRDRRWNEAYLAWADGLPDRLQSELGNVYNGGFETEPSNRGFDWRLSEVAGAYVERLHSAGVGGELALRVSFEGQRVPFHHVRQLLALPVGRYRLDGRARAEGLRTERGLSWRVFCADNGRSLASSEPLTGTTTWRGFSFEFEVPEAGCGGQWLQLELPARIPAEQRVAGRAWFDDLGIVRVRPAPLAATP